MNFSTNCHFFYLAKNLENYPCIGTPLKIGNSSPFSVFQDFTTLSFPQICHIRSSPFEWNIRIFNKENAMAKFEIIVFVFFFVYCWSLKASFSLKLSYFGNLWYKIDFPCLEIFFLSNISCAHLFFPSYYYIFPILFAFTFGKKLSC